MLQQHFAGFMNCREPAADSNVDHRSTWRALRGWAALESYSSPHLICPPVTLEAVPELIQLVSSLHTIIKHGTLSHGTIPIFGLAAKAKHGYRAMQVYQ